MKQQLETTKIEEVKESNYVVILDPPEVPVERSEPKRKQMVILAGLLGLGLGLVFSYILEHVKNSDEVSKEKMSMVKKLLLKNISELIPGQSKN